MHFKPLTLATVVLSAGSAFGAPQLGGQLGGTDIVNDLTQLASSITGTNNALQQLTFLNAILQVPAAIAGFTTILGQILAFDSALDLGGGALPSLSTGDQTKVCDALTNVNGVYTGLVTTLSGKLSLLNALGFGAILAQVLSTGLVEVDSFERQIIAQVPLCAADATSQLGALESALQAAIRGFGGTVPNLPALSAV